MKFTLQKLILISALLAGVLVWYFWTNKESIAHKKSINTAQQNSEMVSASRSPDRSEDVGSAAKSNGPPNASQRDVTQLIEEALSKFLASADAGESAAILQQLRDSIRKADAQSAAAAIIEFLKSGRDADTKLPFKVGSDGILEASPTLRTALLDLLPSLDPGAALDVAREVMDQKKSADEYALGIRNLAWNDLDGDMKGELKTRFDQMLEEKAWVETPSAGFLEAFDAAVELSGIETFETVNGIRNEAITTTNSSLARASFIALDRMTVRDPSLLVEAFGAEGMLNMEPDQRASLLSRLDITDPAQKKVFTRYLGATNHGPEELNYFADLFPNGNYIYGNWLITSEDPSLSIDSRLAADRKVLTEINGLNLPGNAGLALARIRNRLTQAAANNTSK